MTRINVDRSAQRVEWHGEEGMENSGTVTLNRVDSGGTDLTLVVDFEPEGFLEYGRRRSRHDLPPDRGPISPA